MDRTSLSPCKRNCSARFWRRGADGVIGIAETKVIIVARTMKRKERMVIVCNLTMPQALRVKSTGFRSPVAIRMGMWPSRLISMVLSWLMAERLGLQKRMGLREREDERMSTVVRGGAQYGQRQLQDLPRMSNE